MSNLAYNYIKMGKKCQLVQSLSLTLFWGSSCSRAAGCHLKSPQRAGWCAGCTAGLSLQYPWGCWAEDKGVYPAASHPPVTVGSQMETYWPPLDLWPKQMKMVWDYGKFFFFTVHMKAFAKKNNRPTWSLQFALTTGQVIQTEINQQYMTDICDHSSHTEEPAQTLVQMLRVSAGPSVTNKGLNGCDLQKCQMFFSITWSFMVVSL